MFTPTVLLSPRWLPGITMLLPGREDASFLDNLNLQRLYISHGLSSEIKGGGELTSLTILGARIL